MCAHYLGTDRPPADLRDRLVRAVHARPVLDLAGLDLAGLGPAVADTAARGDPAARTILATAAERLTATLAPWPRRPASPSSPPAASSAPGRAPDRPGHPACPFGPALHPVRDGLPGATALAGALL
ncbi:hypothetical protein [Streptomyces tremellae]|uniref:hypothetical protein n=1 Tax=Streptomyces tremellae TaxID=1124239 RepID=UPI0031E76361